MKKKTKKQETRIQNKCSSAINGENWHGARANPPPHPPLLHVFGVFYDGDETTKKEAPATSFFQTSPRLFQLAPYVKCHQIKRARKKKQKLLPYLLNSQNNDRVLLLKTMVRHWRCFLSSVVTDGKDWNLKTLAQRFQVLILCLLKSPKCLNWFDILFSTLQQHFMYG